MKTLILMRHAKAGWDNPADSDAERPLNPRGKKDALRMGKFLVKQGLCPEIVVASTAKRAKKTAEKMIKGMSFDGPVELNPNLYASSVGSYVEVLNQQLDSHQSVLLIGHNPIIEDFLSALTGDWHQVKTATIAHLQVTIDSWTELSHKSPATLENYWFPKMISE